jgi:hypothetical protein
VKIKKGVFTDDSVDDIKRRDEAMDNPVDNSMNDIKRPDEVKDVPIDTTRIVSMRRSNNVVLLAFNETMKQMKGSDKDDRVDHSLDEIRRLDEFKGVSIDITRIDSLRGKNITVEEINQKIGSDDS